MNETLFWILINKSYNDASLEGVIWRWETNIGAMYGGNAVEKAPAYRTFTPENIEGADVKAAIEAAKQLSQFASHLTNEEGQQYALEQAFPEESKVHYEKEKVRLYGELIEIYGVFPVLEYEDTLILFDEDSVLCQGQKKAIELTLSLVGIEKVLEAFITGITKNGSPYWGNQEVWRFAGNMAVTDNGEYIPLGLTQEQIDSFMTAFTKAQLVEKKRRQEREEKSRLQQIEMEKQREELRRQKQRPILKKR
jgi:hypothetical protein